MKIRFFGKAQLAEVGNMVRRSDLLRLVMKDVLQLSKVLRIFLSLDFFFWRSPGLNFDN